MGSTKLCVEADFWVYKQDGLERFDTGQQRKNRPAQACHRLPPYRQLHYHHREVARMPATHSARLHLWHLVGVLL